MHYLPVKNKKHSAFVTSIAKQVSKQDIQIQSLGAYLGVEMPINVGFGYPGKAFIENGVLLKQTRGGVSLGKSCLSLSEIMTLTSPFLSLILEAVL